MSKLKITGNTTPIVGVKEFYSVIKIQDDVFPDSKPNTPNVFDQEIKWFIYILDRGKWRLAKGNEKTGAKVDFKFTQVSLRRKEIKMIVHAYGEKAMIDIKPQKASEGKILHVDLLDANYNIPTRPFAYRDYIIARVHCVDMELLDVKVTLWEDDGDKYKQNNNNIKIDTKQEMVINGMAYVSFYLDPNHTWLANAKLAKGDKDEGGFHEYYVTAEIFEKIPLRASSKNTNVPNPDYKPPVSEPKKTTPAQQKGPSKKEQKGIVTSGNKVHDYHEQKVAVKKTVNTDPFFESLNSYLKVGMKPWKYEDKKENSNCPNCDKDITLLEFNEMFPNSKQLFYKGTNKLSQTTQIEFVAALNNTFKEFKINTCTRKAFFLAQIARETGNFSRIDENLNYSTESALHAYWTEKNNPNLYSNAGSFLNNPEKLGNYVYRNIGENGDENSGDGYKFRGRGLIQITRKKGYQRFGQYCGKNLASNPDLLLSNLNLMVRSAGWYWKHGVILKNGSEKDINTVADLEDFTKTTELIHGSTIDVIKREEILNKIKVVLHTDDCKRNVANILSDADIEYHIFYSGIIRYKLQDEKRENASYYYHDQKGTVHNIGKYDLKKIKNDYGKDYHDRLGSVNVYLFDIRTLKNYHSGDTQFILKMNPGTNRFFMNDVTIASFIGAMLDCSYTDFVFNGFSDDFGNSIGGSRSHKNGMNGDIRYLRKDKSGKNVHLSLESETGDPCGWKGMDEKRQNEFNDALYKYGWKSMLSWKYNGKLLNHSKHYVDHYHHLHVQSFKPTLKKIK